MPMVQGSKKKISREVEKAFQQFSQFTHSTGYQQPLQLGIKLYNENIC